MSNLEEAQKTKQNLIQITDRMIQLLDLTPEDKLNWSPSPTSRTPVQLVGHAAGTLSVILDMLKTKRVPPVSDHAALDAHLREMESKMTSKSDVTALMKRNRDEFASYIDSLDEAGLAEEAPSLRGPAPRVEGITFAVWHTSVHVSQLEYVQTIWGDRDWHF